MQFKHPEILWALFLLLIPILIHLFQLRRFKKTAFTNVAMLQKVVSESRKSNTLKKWLLLLTRLLLLAALVIAFAQPFSASQTALRPKETVVYLDDSFSMQAKANGLSLLEKSVQDFIKSVESEQVFSLFTNQSTFKNVVIDDIQNNLLSLPYSPKQLTFDEIMLKAGTLFSEAEGVQRNLILISDFQQSLAENNSVLDSVLDMHWVVMQAKSSKNISIDSTFIENSSLEQVTLKVLLSGGENEETLPISLYNSDTLIAKTSAKFDAGGASELSFSIPANKQTEGRFQISDSGLVYDNQFFFSINSKKKINVLGIGDFEDNYLARLYGPEEFVLTQTSLNQLDYSSIDQQNVVVLNKLKSIPNSLQKVLRTFKSDGGTVIVIPDMETDLSSFNQFLSAFNVTQLTKNNSTEKRLTTISFDHPLYKNVFERRVDNFEYPKVNQFFSVKSIAPTVLSLEGGEAFLVGRDGFYLFTAPLDSENSNFKNSPLIVPTFYNMAVFSLQTPDLYHTLGTSKSLDIPVNLGTDDILQVSNSEETFIPLQQSFPNKVRLSFSDNPDSDGIFNIKNDQDILGQISFNFPRNESQLNYLDVNNFPNVTVQNSVPQLFDNLETASSITAYWKWFVIFALLLALIEVIIQKFVT